MRYDPLTCNKSSDSWKPLPPPRLASALGYPRKVRLGSLRRTGSVTLVEFKHQLHTAYYAPGLLTRDATVFHTFGNGVSYCHVKHCYLTVVACYTPTSSWLGYRLLLLYAARLFVEHCPHDGPILQCLACDVRSDGVSIPRSFRQETFAKSLNRSFLFGYDSGVMTDGECTRCKEMCPSIWRSPSDLSHQSSTLQTFKLSSTRTKLVQSSARSIRHFLVVQCLAL